MKSRFEYDSNTSNYELLSYCLDRLFASDFETFGDLTDFLDTLPRDKRVEFVYPRWFRVYRGIRWGRFSDLNPLTYRELWKALVTPRAGYRSAGDLKRDMTITSLYCGIVDIHGYSEFCQRVGNNVSMLQHLDEVIQVDVATIAAEEGVLSTRSRGDEIVLIGARAVALLRTVMKIAELFSKARSLDAGSSVRVASGGPLLLPAMAISAGIAGGQKYTPLVITGDGDISGHLINSAARLQSRANKLSPTRTKVLLTTQVMSATTREVSEGGVTLEVGEDGLDDGVFFWPSGQIRFKGITLGVQELVFRDEDAYKRELRTSFERLLTVLKNERWEDYVFSEAVILVERAAANMPQFTISATSGTSSIGNQDVMEYASRVRKAYESGKDYSEAIAMFGTLIGLCERIEGFDEHVLEYLREIYERYQWLLGIFTSRLDELVEKRIGSLLAPEMRDAYRKAEANNEVLRRIRAKAQQSPELDDRKSMWFRVVRRHRADVRLDMYSEKS
jgi:class 3 adenylate cyclase